MMFLHVTAGDELLKLKDVGAEAETAEEHLHLNEASASDNQPLGE